MCFLVRFEFEPSWLKLKTLRMELTNLTFKVPKWHRTNTSRTIYVFQLTKYKTQHNYTKMKNNNKKEK